MYHIELNTYCLKYNEPSEVILDYGERKGMFIIVNIIIKRYYLKLGKLELLLSFPVNVPQWYYVEVINFSCRRRRQHKYITAP